MNEEKRPLRYFFDESKLDAVICAAYDLSRPQGLGFLSAVEGPLDGETLRDIKAGGFGAYRAAMDYVMGRSVKLDIRYDGDRLYISAERWYDHSLSDLRLLAARAKLGEPE